MCFTCHLPTCILANYLMKIGLIADIHGNLQALERVLAALDAAGVELVLCVGDLVCYGANPNEVLALVRERGIFCVTGIMIRPLPGICLKRPVNHPARAMNR